MKDTSSLGYYRSLFLVPKLDGSFRSIIDLKKLNLFLDILPFKVEILISIIAALQPQEWITKIDLKDAYHHILNIPKNFCFVIAGKTYQFRLSTAPRVFTKTLAPVVQLLRTHGIFKSSCIFQRFDHPSGFTRIESFTYPKNHATSTNFGMVYQLEEVYARTLTYSRLLRTLFQSWTYHEFSSGLILRLSHQCPIPSVNIHGHACMENILHHQSDIALRSLYPS